MEKLDYLITNLLREEGRSEYQLPLDRNEKQRLYRSLVNIREAKPISPEFLQAEDDYLQGELKKQEIMYIHYIKTVKEEYPEEKLENGDKIGLWRGDITKLEVDAIVNAANSRGLGCFLPNHNCIDNQIQTFAGVRLRLECNEFMKTIGYNLKTSHCFITKGYNLPAKHVIHAVGPIVENELTEELKKLLADTYRNCLACAIENKVRTISFPCISTGVFRFPKEEASKIAIKTVDQFISNHRDDFDKIIFNLWSEEDVRIYERNIK